MLRAVRTTPGRLRIALAAVLLTCAAFAAAGLGGLTARASALEAARTEAADQVRLETARTKLVIADAAAAVDVLLTTDQPAFAPHDYSYALQPAVINAAIAGRQADDAYAMAGVSVRTATYAGQVDEARTLARLGPEQADQAAQKLIAASSELRGQILPRLAVVQARSDARLQQDQEGARTGPLPWMASAAVALLALVLVQVWLTRRTRRMLNVPLALGLVLLVAAATVTLVTLSASRKAAEAVASGPHAVTRAVAQARASAFEARSIESLGVLGRGAKATDSQWRQSMQSARAALATAAPAASPAVREELAALSAGLDTYERVHVRLLSAAPGGTAARDIAVGPSQDGSVGSFEAFDAGSGALVARQSERDNEGWALAQENLRLAAWLCLVCGLAAAVLGWVGINPRLREYA